MTQETYGVVVTLTSRNMTEKNELSYGRYGKVGMVAESKTSAEEWGKAHDGVQEGRVVPRERRESTDRWAERDSRNKGGGSMFEMNVWKDQFARKKEN